MDTCLLRVLSRDSMGVAFGGGGEDNDLKASKREAAQFLAEAKRCVSLRRVVGPFEDDWETLGVLGITPSEVQAVILSLTVDDYCSGPEPDRDPRRPGDVWLFLHHMEDSSLELYIKLKVSPDGPYLIVLSFHPPEHPIRPAYD